MIPCRFPPTDLRSTYYKSLWGVDVRKAALSWFVVKTIAGVLFLCVAAYTEHVLYTVFGVLLLNMATFLLIGYINMVPWLFWPETIFVCISAAFSVGTFFYRITFGIAIFFVRPRHFRHLLDLQNQNQPELYRSQLAWTYVGVSIGHLVLSGIFLYFLSVLIRAFQCVNLLSRRHKHFWLVKRQGTVTGCMV